jgi:hypothetical protein
MEQCGGKSTADVAVRIKSRIFALTAAIWHNNKAGQPVKWFLIANDR